MKLSAVSPDSIVPDMRPFAADEHLCHVPLNAKAAARAAVNVATWREYLPSDCIRTMIQMGWDYTT
jgi:hypothetical protein